MKHYLITFALFLVAFGSLEAQQKTVLVSGLTTAQVAELRDAVPEVRITESMDRVGEVDAIVGNVSPAVLRKAKNLKWFQTRSAGVERYLHMSGPEFRDSDVVLTNGKIVQGPEISEHAFALLLAVTRGLHRFRAAQGRGQWSRDDTGMVELRGKTAVVIGVGGIGSQIAIKAKAFGMTVIGVEPKDMPLVPFLDKLVPPDRLDTVLPEADVVFIAAPHTPESHKMMGPSQFELLKKGSYFIAVSRGRIYDLNALVKALDSKRLAGAGVDVTDPEPLPSGHPLWKFDNVFITPHVAGRSDRVWNRRKVLFTENLKRFAAGEPLLNVVDKQKGY
ncbi:MAG: D-2-hydroxyacid dehydrogenase [bacterium]|nr:D-2-hydroxyacid dehydrogenase [bacterium]